MPKFDLLLSPPMMNAAGMLGFTPDLTCGIDWARLGAFVTAPISLAARSPAHGPRCLAFPGGFLLHTGYPNPGLKTVLKRYAPRWARAPMPVIVHLLARDAAELVEMARRLEGVEGVMAVEIGLPVEADGSAVQALTAAAAGGELPVIVRLPLEQAAALAPAALAAGAVAVSLGAPRGLLFAPQAVSGRLYGPAVFPQALKVVQTLAQDKRPVIAAGGVYRLPEVEAMRAAGALAVQLDSALWRGE